MTVRRIACCTDFSENAESAFETALEMAEKYQATLFVLHVVPPVINPLVVEAGPIPPTAPEASLIQEIEERMVHQYGDRIGDRVDFKLRVLDGHVSTEIINFLQENLVDVVVVGSYGLTGMGLVLFGSVATQVTRGAPCSVMIVRRRKTGAD